MPAHKSVVQFLTSGTYKREEDDNTGVSYTAGTEVEISVVANNLFASLTEDVMFSWARCEAYLFDTTKYQLYEWALIRCAQADALQDLNDEDAVAALHREGRLLKRGMIYQNAAPYGRCKPIKFEVYNVKLLPAEELRLVVRPLVSSGAGTIEEHIVLEWRKVGE